MPNDDPAWQSAVELAAAIRAKSVSPVDVTKALLARIERLNPKLNAFVTLHAEAALCAAGKAEQQGNRRVASHLELHPRYCRIRC